jgi:hypothetical protein
MIGWEKKNLAGK